MFVHVLIKLITNISKPTPDTLFVEAAENCMYSRAIMSSSVFGHFMKSYEEMLGFRVKRRIDLSSNL